MGVSLASRRAASLAVTGLKVFARDPLDLPDDVGQGAVAQVPPLVLRDGYLAAARAAVDDVAAGLPHRGEAIAHQRDVEFPRGADSSAKAGHGMVLGGRRGGPQKTSVQSYPLAASRSTRLAAMSRQVSPRSRAESSPRSR